MMSWINRRGAEPAPCPVRSGGGTGRFVAAVAVALSVAACSGPADARLEEAEDRSLTVVVELPVVVAVRPFHDVGWATLEEGQEVTAVCYTSDHQAQTGASGNAIKVRVGDLEGFAATTTLDAEQDERRSRFNLSDVELAERLPECEAERSNP